MDNFNGMNEGPLPLGAGIPMPPPVPQLPPQMFTTAAQLLDLTDSETHRYSIMKYYARRAQEG